MPNFESLPPNLIPGGLGTGCKLGKSYLRNPRSEVNASLAAVIEATDPLNHLKGPLKQPLLAWATAQVANGRSGRPSAVYQTMNFNPDDESQAQAAFELVVELAQGKENDLTWIGALSYFLHDFPRKHGGTYGGFSQANPSWIRPVFLLICRCLKLNQDEPTQDSKISDWRNELIYAVEGEFATATLYEQLDAILAPDSRVTHIVRDVRWQGW